MNHYTYFVDVENIKPSWLLRAIDVVSRSKESERRVKFVVCTRRSSKFECNIYPWVTVLRASSDLPEAADVLIMLEVHQAALRGENIFIVHGGDKIYDTFVHQMLGLVEGISIDRFHYKSLSFASHQSYHKRIQKHSKVTFVGREFRKPLEATFGDTMRIKMSVNVRANLK